MPFAAGPFRSIETDPAECARVSAHLKDTWQQSDIADLPSAFHAFLSSVACHAPYLSHLLSRHHDLVARLCEDDIDNVIDSVVSGLISLSAQTLPTMPLEAVMARLRHAKSCVHLLCALGDLSGQRDLHATTATLSQLASATLQVALDWLLVDLERAGHVELLNPETPSHDCGIVVMGMGKFGARELNYSSDIDLIIVYEPNAAGLRHTGVKSPGETMNRFARQMVRIMDERTGDGYVFRTDLRLRPDPGATPLAITLDFAVAYYESRGQNWERAAMIKAAPVAGDMALGQRFLDELRPFIWRRYLDFAAIADIKSIKRQINAQRGHKEIRVGGHNVKLGRGGIREIEFFVQTQQLIAGGRDPGLRGRQTVATLFALAERGWISQRTAQELEHCYGDLRRAEHVAQMIGDEQTHTIPDAAEARLALASLLGFATLDAFDAHLTQTLKTVERHFASLFENEVNLGSGDGNLSFTGDEPDPSTVDVLSALGFERPRDIWSIIRTWHTGRYRALQWEKARERLTELTPVLLAELARTPRPDATMIRFDELLSRLPAGMQMFSLLQNNPSLIRLLSTILAASPAMSDTIAQNPLVFDGMIDPAFLTGVPDPDDLAHRIDLLLSGIDNHEEQLDRLRMFTNEQRFLVSARLLTGVIDPLEAGGAFSDLADQAVKVALRVAMANLAERHGVIPGARVALLALGRLGSREMTASSDLDLIMIYDAGDGDPMSDGEKPLSASQYYSRLTQRLIAALSAPMAQGVLYELDFRLRPSGNKGPLATSLSAFCKYQHNDAWTWEHMVLCRARPVAGDPSLCAQIDAAVIDILDKDRDIDTTRRDVADMRARLARDKPGRDAFDVKRMDGGMTDIDFVAQFLRLTKLRKLNLKPMRADRIFELLDDEVIGADDTAILRDAFADYSAIIQMVRLCTDDGFDPDAAPPGMTERILGHFDVPDTAVLRGHLEAARGKVAAISSRVLGVDWPVGEGKP